MINTSNLFLYSYLLCVYFSISILRGTRNLSVFTNIKFIIYLQKIPLDTTYFPTQKYKIPYHATNVIFSVSPSYIFYPPRKNPAPDGGFWIRLVIWAETFVIIKIATLFNVSAKRLVQRNKIKHDKYVFLLCRNMFTDCDVGKILARRRNVASDGINFTISWAYR